MAQPHDSAFYEYPFSTPVVEPEPPAPPAWTAGIEPVSRPVHSGNDTGFVSVIVLLMLGLCISFRSLRRIRGTLVKHLWSIRSRDGYEQTTAGERRTVGLLLCVAVFFIALIGLAGLSRFRPALFTLTFGTTMAFAGVIAAYFVFQYAVYAIVGLTFATDERCRLWIEGFTASMSLLGLTLLLPGLTVLFYPDLTVAAVAVAAALYVTARIMFICKGFRIFYTNLGSIVYFILYLCSLEFIPFTILYYSACLVCNP